MTNCLAVISRLGHSSYCLPSYYVRSVELHGGINLCWQIVALRKQPGTSNVSKLPGTRYPSVPLSHQYVVRTYEYMHRMSGALEAEWRQRGHGLEKSSEQGAVP